MSVTKSKTELGICDLVPQNVERLKETAWMLFQGYKECRPDIYPSQVRAMGEVRASLGEGRISRVAVLPDGELRGWIAAASHYKGYVWELHPLVVGGAFRRQGIGRALVRDLVKQVKARGGRTIWTSTEGKTGGTSLSGAELFPGVLDRLKNIQGLHEHPFEFYRKAGFEVIGVMPDAGGPGKPDIYMGMLVI